MLKERGQNLSRKVTEFRRLVLAFYRSHGREHLPWRDLPVLRALGGTHDPYFILVSEMMLQQTQVDRVIPYFTRWCKKFPTVRSLAKASLQDVLCEWSGLGYNRRAKYLHDAAKQMVARHGGALPRSYDELRALTGIGDYTAKAVRVFAFNEPEVMIETNIRAAIIHHFYPRSRKVADNKLKPILHMLCKLSMNNKNTRRKGVNCREWYAALMDYGSHLKKLHPNPSRRSKHHTKQSKFEGSLRQVRGAILKVYTRGEDITGLRNPYIEKFDEALDSLMRDGLIKK